MPMLPVPRPGRDVAGRGRDRALEGDIESPWRRRGEAVSTVWGRMAPVGGMCPSGGPTTGSVSGSDVRLNALVLARPVVEGEGYRLRLGLGGELARGRGAVNVGVTPSRPKRGPHGVEAGRRALRLCPPQNVDNLDVGLRLSSDPSRSLKR
mmetsp:Transcript_73253/g.172141  ORF Transcript_73253/g.172141 Transcript_73253/m.172141 type:complete len:151 (-) Transcript_73253:13-465(-)